MKVLVAEDDRLTREALSEILTGEGYSVIAVSDGSGVMTAVEKENPDLICLDIMMPGADGFSLCRKIRSRTSDTPVIFISAKSEEIDKVIGLELGADDFIVKPFGVREVVARIRAVTRRYLAGKSACVKVNASMNVGEFVMADLRVYPAELRCKRGDETIELSLREIEILRLFADNPGKVLNRFSIFDAVWGEEHQPVSRTLDQHISQLRKKIEIDPKNPVIIRTVHGAGYRFDPPEAER